MRLRSAVEREIRDLIQERGRITFAEFMHTCLYSPRGGFYASREQRISTHFGTSAMSHPVFGALIARQLEQMWHVLEEPPIFHVVEVGSGDGSLARSIVAACRQTAPRFARALYYVAADYAPRWLHSSEHDVDWHDANQTGTLSSRQEPLSDIQRVKTAGLRAFRNIVGCVLCNELIDNFPVHRFAIQGGRVKEIYVTSAAGTLTEVLDEPSSPCIEARLARLGLSLSEGYRGEVNLAMEVWTCELARVLERGFALTIDYGEQAADLYAPGNDQGTLVCYRQHDIGKEPYQHIGQQDITCLVDFTSLMRLGERHGLATVGYTAQSRFLEKLGFASFLEALDTQGLSAARTALSRMAMMALVDPEQYGDFKVLAQAKGTGSGIELVGFAREEKT